MGCTNCHLHQYRFNQVLGRGDIPADVLMIGEGPGKTENVLGFAFVGEAGRLLDRAIARAVIVSGVDKPSIYMTNILQCRPCDSKSGKNREPTGEESWRCKPNLDYRVSLVKPKCIILLGKVPKKFCGRSFPGATCLQHPSFIVRTGGEKSGYFQAFVRGLSEVFLDV